jgi:hypothetical protein
MRCGLAEVHIAHDPSWLIKTEVSERFMEQEADLAIG